MAVIHFTAGTSLNTALVWKNLNELMEQINGEKPFKIFEAEPRQEIDLGELRLQILFHRRTSYLFYSGVDFNDGL